METSKNLTRQLTLDELISSQEGSLANPTPSPESERERRTSATCGRRCLRVIRECSPRYVVGENVRGLVGWNGGLVFEEVCGLGSSRVRRTIVRTSTDCGVGAPHRRDRVWFVANRQDIRLSQTKGARRERREQEPNDRQKVRHTSDTNGTSRDAPDTDGLRLEHGTEPGSIAEGERKIRERIARQPPSTRLGQGFQLSPLFVEEMMKLPKELDGITFSKWRRESIRKRMETPLFLKSPCRYLRP